jgi:DsbC/DsbD-like thiol-disulfide interchange protein
MMARRFAGVVLLVAGLSFPTVAQSSASVVKVKPEQSAYALKGSSVAKVVVVLDIQEGYHINANKPAESFLIPTALKLGPTPGLKTTPVVYPRPKRRKFAFSEKPMLVYEGEVLLSFTAKALPSLPAGPLTLKGKLTVQACNEEACLRPQTIDVPVVLEVEK